MTLKQIAIGVLNVVFAYVIIIFSATIDIISGFGIPIGIYLVLVSVNICLIVLLLICAIFDLVTMISLKRKPYNKRVMGIREKTKKYFKTIAILCACFPVLILMCALLFSR